MIIGTLSNNSFLYLDLADHHPHSYNISLVYEGNKWIGSLLTQNHIYGDNFGILRDHDEQINSVAFSPNSTILASCDDNHVILWDLISGEKFSIKIRLTQQMILNPLHSLQMGLI